MDRPTFTLINADNGPIDTLRNDIVEKALAIGVTKLLMLDTDMIYQIAGYTADWVTSDVSKFQSAVDEPRTAGVVSLPKLPLQIKGLAGKGRRHLRRRLRLQVSLGNSVSRGDTVRHFEPAVSGPNDREQQDLPSQGLESVLIGLKRHPP